MDNYTEYEKLDKMFTDEFLDLMIEKNVIISDELIDYLFTFEERKDNFEKQITKAIKSKNTNKEAINLLIDIYEKEAKKHKDEKSTEIIEIKTYQNPYLTEKEKKEIALIPSTDISEVDNKNYQIDLFLLRYPIFSLKLQKKAEVYQFNTSKNSQITISSNYRGRATIQDGDLWLYCISKMMQLAYEKKEYTRKIFFTGYDFLKKTGKTTGGANYQNIKDSLHRLSQTSFVFDVSMEDGISAGRDTALIEIFDYVVDKNNKKIGFTVTFPEWLYLEVVNNRIAKINPEYFKLKPFEKRLYHLAKIHHYLDKKTNKIVSISCNLDYFSKKMGSKLELKHFRQQIKKLIEKQPLPEYLIIYDNKKDQVRFAFKDNDKNQIIEHKEIKRKIEAKELREKIEKNKEKKKPENIEKNLKLIKKYLQDFEGKTYPIFQTKILTYEKLKEYLREFEFNYLVRKILENIDYDFIKCKNPEGYFYTILKNGLDQPDLPFGDK